MLLCLQMFALKQMPSHFRTPRPRGFVCEPQKIRYQIAASVGLTVACEREGVLFALAHNL